MTKANGSTVRWIMGILLGVALTALASMNAMGVFQGEIKRDVVHNHEAIEAIQPDVKQNTEHRIKFEERVAQMADSIETIRKAVEK